MEQSFANIILKFHADLLYSMRDLHFLTVQLILNKNPSMNRKVDSVSSLHQAHVFSS